jgi:hypothetical protein
VLDVTQLDKKQQALVCVSDRERVAERERERVGEQERERESERERVNTYTYICMYVYI